MLGLVAAGVALYGEHKKKKAERDAENANGDYYRAQREMTQFARDRSADIYRRQADEFIGDQEVLIAKSGVSFSGTALAKVIQSKYAAEKETYAIIKQGSSDMKLAGFRAEQARRNSAYLGNTANNVIGAISTFLNYGGDDLAKMNSKTPIE